MTAIWLLSTRGRPDACQQTLDACERSGMTSPGVVYVDETVDDYRDIRLPKNWTIHYEPEWGSLQASMSWCFKKYPKASQYGWLADDVRPRTQGWDKVLEAEAGRWCLSYARDMWFSEGERSRWDLEEGHNLSSGLCWGGELVRTVGWWALPGVRQAWIDVAWTRIIHPLEIARYADHVVVEHLNYRTGKRPKDAVDDWSRAGDDYIERDIKIGEQWARSSDYADIMERLRKTVKVELTPDQVTRRMQRELGVALQRSRDNYVNAHWSPGESAARLIRVMEDFDKSVRSEEIAKIFSDHTNSGQV